MNVVFSLKNKKQHRISFIATSHYNIIMTFKFLSEVKNVLVLQLVNYLWFSTVKFVVKKKYVFNLQSCYFSCVSSRY